MVYPIVIMIVVLSHGNIIFNGLGEYISKNRYRHYLSNLISPTLLACSANHAAMLIIIIMIAWRRDLMMIKQLATLMSNGRLRLKLSEDCTLECQEIISVELL